jgi:hypothetical protein
MVSCGSTERGSASYIECEEGHVLVSVVDIAHDGDSCFSRPMII